MERKPLDLHQYLRRPDRAFWFDLLKAPPKPTETAAMRRARVGRAALGLATVITLLYALVSALVAWESTGPVILANLVCAGAFGLGMWMAALDKPAIARTLLMVTLNAQIAVLLWFTGNLLGIGVYGFAAAGLAAALYPETERPLRLLFFGVPAVLVTLSLTLATAAHIDLSELPPGLLAFTRVANAVFAMYALFLLLALSEREVLRSEHDLVGARESSDRLLNAVLPKRIADELRQRERMIADRHPEVTVLFADIAGFTPWSAQQPPETVVALLEKVFSRFDRLVAAGGAEKIKTIGDAYMVISGAPDPRRDHAHVIARLALQLLAEVEAVRLETGIPLNLRVGIHSGEVIAGVIGALRFSYDVWGDTVNTASRMESHGEPGRIQISDETRALLGNDFRCEPRGNISVKGKGEMTTWWLIGERVSA
jgi:class 3 adenylate cyclase